MTEAEDKIFQEFKRMIAAKSRDEFVAALAELRSAPPRLTQGPGIFHLLDEDSSTITSFPQKVPVVILKVKKPWTRIYWKGAYDPKDVKPPTCMSLDDIRPEEGVPEQQSEFCNTCEQNKWTHSPETGARIKPRCDSKHTVAVFVPGQAGAYQFNIGVGSKETWKNFATDIVNNGLSLIEVVTEVGFNPKDPNTLVFKELGYIDNKQLLSAGDWTELMRVSQDEDLLARLTWGSKEREAQYADARRAPAAKALPAPEIEQLARIHEVNTVKAIEAEIAKEKIASVSVGQPIERRRRPVAVAREVDAPVPEKAKSVEKQQVKPPLTEERKQFQNLANQFGIDEL